MLERWNTHFSTTVEQELFGIVFQLAQDPNSNNLGTTVWDASIVLAKYIEKNSRRGDYSRPRMRGRRVLELGAGMGLAGMAMALLGADVEFTDIGDVLPLLQRNISENISAAALKVKDAAWAAAEVGGARVAALDWADPSTYSAFQPPYDYILAADCVYNELAVPHLLAACLHLSGPRTQTIVTYELRSQTVHKMFLDQFGEHFTIRKVPVNKMDPGYQHPLIHIYLLKRRKQPLEGAQQQPAAVLQQMEGQEQVTTQAEQPPISADDADEAGSAGLEAELGGAGSCPGVALSGQGNDAQLTVPPGSLADTQMAYHRCHDRSCGQDAAAERGTAAELTALPGDSGGGEHVAAADGSREARLRHAAAAAQRQFAVRREGSMLARTLKNITL